MQGPEEPQLDTKLTALPEAIDEATSAGLRKGNVFVGDLASNTVKEIPFSGGVYGAPITLGSGLNAPFSVAVDKNGRLYVLDVENIWRFAP